MPIYFINILLNIKQPGNSEQSCTDISIHQVWIYKYKYVLILWKNVAQWNVINDGQSVYVTCLSAFYEPVFLQTLTHAWVISTWLSSTPPWCLCHHFLYTFCTYLDWPLKEIKSFVLWWFRNTFIFWPQLVVKNF